MRSLSFSARVTVDGDALVLRELNPERGTSIDRAALLRAVGNNVLVTLEPEPEGTEVLTRMEKAIAAAVETAVAAAKKAERDRVVLAYDSTLDGVVLDDEAQQQLALLRERIRSGWDGRS